MKSWIILTILLVSVLAQDACNQPTNAQVRIVKQNKQYSNTEEWVITDESNNVVKQQNGGTGDDVNDSFDVCHTAGNWKIVLTDVTDGGWTSGSLLIISLYRPEDGYETISIGTLWSGYTVTYYVNTQYSIFPGSTLKLMRTSVPVGWYQPTFDDSTWEDFTANAINVSGQHIYLFRGTFTVNSLANFHGIDMAAKVRQAYVMYINGVEVYRYNLPSGEITADTDSLSDTTAISYKQVSYTLGSVHIGTNVFAVAVVRLASQSYGSVDQRFSFRLMSESSQFGHSYGFGSRSASDGSTAGNLYDFKPDTNWRVSKSSGVNPWVAFAYSNARANYINKYCITSANREPQMDPASWTISASDDGTTYTTLSTESAISWQSRNERQCFFIPNQSKPWNAFKLEFTETADTTYQYLGFAELEIMVEDLQSLNPAPFALTPNDITAYVGENVPQMSESDEVYAKYRISPALPSPLVMDTNNGRIHGIAAAPLSRTTYTVTAANHLGVDCTTTFSLTIQACSSPNSIFTISLTTNESGDMGWELYSHGSTSLLDSRTDLAKYATLNYPLCRPNGLYDLKLTSKVATGWGTGTYAVYDSVSALLSSGTVSVNEAPKTIVFSSGYFVSPLTNTWKYLNGVVAPASGWKTATFDEANWLSGTPGTFGTPAGVTQYYRSTFSFTSSTDGYSGVELNINVQAGAIVYLNNKEIFRTYMPSGEASVDTIATGTRDVATTVNHAVGLIFDPLVQGVNVLAIEIHHYTTIPSEIVFDASLRLVVDKSYRVYDGVASGIPAKSGNEGDEYCWDNNILSKTLKAGCDGVTFQYTFNDQRQELVTAYEVFNANDCNQRHPSSWRLEGSNDGTSWTVLHRAKDQFFTAYRESKSFTFYNNVAYNSYRLYVTECNNTPLDTINCGEGSVQLGEIRLLLSSTVISCPAQDGYSPAIEGTDAYKPCSNYYSGSYSKTCTNGVLGTEMNECKLMAPVAVSYPSKAYVLYQKTATTITPVVQAANYTCAVNPTLFDGLTIQPSTGIISGKPTAIQESKTFTISCSNNVGSAVETELSLSVEAAPGAPVWVYVILVIAIVIILCIVGFCLYARLKGSNKKKTHVALDKKKAAKTDDKKQNKTVRI